MLFLALCCIAFDTITPLSAQCYTTFRDSGIELFKKRQWKEAKDQFQQAANCKSDKPVTNDLAAWTRKCEIKIAKQERDRQRREDEEADHAFWESLKNGDVADCDLYLNKCTLCLHTKDADDRKTEMLALVPKEVKAYRDCANCPLMTPVEGGIYTMGSPENELGRGRDECPHRVSVANFSIGVYEVTVEEYLRFADETKSHYPAWLETGNPSHVMTGKDPYYKNLGYSRTSKNLPVCGVNYDSAVAYCEWLSRKTGKKYRLPLEKEWEYAARGGQKYAQYYLYAGNSDLNAVGWFADNANNMAHPVGKKAPNKIGLYDMSGNLWEWCQGRWSVYPDCTFEDYPGCAILRGGSWSSLMGSCRSACRFKNVATYRLNYYGFRCARDGHN